jgi:hypothetical protein
LIYLLSVLKRIQQTKYVVNQKIEQSDVQVSFRELFIRIKVDLHRLTLGLYVPLIDRFKSLLFMQKLLRNTLIYSSRTVLTIFLKRKRVVCILSQYILYLYQIALYISRPSTLYSLYMSVFRNSFCINNKLLNLSIRGT